MSGNTKEKIAVRNNAGKKTPAATAPMANAYANATVLEKIENLAATFCHRKCNETSSKSLGYRPSKHTARVLRDDQAQAKLGHDVATMLQPSSVAT
ncbi:hypothetical protein DY000_02021209 [Brassica cretica]|uniref:Uncharacterized protein n=1 Tax=Brassica cretica TaxID=69181 RepID=A0ABQ7E1S7_BRACR|nr:hypothetical protein DY000_02021209 [Brassica cretica]